MIADPSLAFWLRYADGHGALSEPDGPATALVVLSDTLRHRHDLPEALLLTADPDVAREDGGVLIAPGHPLLDDAAEQVLTVGDIGVCCLPWPTKPAPSRDVIEVQARDWYSIDHGRIDLVDTPQPVYLPVLRAGALLTYEVSLDVRFQERGEVWLDATTALELTPDLSAQIDAQVDAGLAVDRRRERLPANMLRAIKGADRILRQRAGARLAELERSTASARDEEVARASAYYDATVTSIRRRQANATTDRADLLEAQARITAVERDRRVAEIHEKFRPRQTIRPYRLHLVLVPALRLPVQVRRGPRTYAWQVVRLLAPPSFTNVTCPTCHSVEPLVAGRDKLGCRACLA
ncbi:MAG: hypothetical protein OEY70_07290 [Acidimicrobiia bacterium]|nr:hypothetical protein [Acidimicrobiia bacterium]